MRPVADKYIAVAGNIGVGKTSLVQYMASEFGFEPFFEPFADNPYLDDFYQDMGRWSFHSQMWFLTHKFRLHQALEHTPGTLVQDRTIYEDAEIFATHLHRSGRMSDRDFATYHALYTAMRRSLRPPDLMIYLRCDLRAMRRRIGRRGRANEQQIPTPYLKSLNVLYEDWISTWTASPLLVWDSANADYLEDLVDQLAFRRAIGSLLD